MRYLITPKETFQGISGSERGNSVSSLVSAPDDPSRFLPKVITESKEEEEKSSTE